MRNIICFMLLAFVLVSCGNKKETVVASVKYAGELDAVAFKDLGQSLKKQIVIENDTLLGIYSQIQSQFENGEEMLYCYNYMQSSIEKFNLSSEKYVGTIKTDSHPGLMSTQWLEFYVASEDSVFLMASGGQVALLVNGQFAQRWNFQRIIDSSTSVAGIDPLNNQTSMLLLNDSTLMLRSYPSYALNGDWKFYKENSSITFNLNTQEVEKHVLQYPEFLLDRSQYLVNDFRYSWAKDAEQEFVLVSYRRDPYLHKVDLNNFESNERIPMPSKYLKRFELMPREYNSQLELNMMVKQGVYHKVHYDPFKKLYYRIASHNQELNNEKTNRLNNAARRPFSVIVLDEDFNYKGEALFEDKNLYSFLNVQVTSEGLVIPIYDDNEDIVTFNIYAIEL